MTTSSRNEAVSTNRRIQMIMDTRSMRPLRTKPMIRISTDRVDMTDTAVMTVTMNMRGMITTITTR